MGRIIKTILHALRLMLVIGAILLGILRFGTGPEQTDRSGWHISEDGTVCYLDENGTPYLGWTPIEGETYYFDPARDGGMVSGWVEIDGRTYCFDESGAMQTGWAESEYGLAYLGENGVLHSGWLEWDGCRYYLDAHGVPCVGWLELDGDRFFFGEDGSMQTGWHSIEGAQYYFSESGAMTIGWLETSEGRFYFGEGGAMQTGWLELDGKKYFLTESGAAHTGWLEEGKDRYYFHEDGVMAIGKVEIDGVPRYFTSTGKYFVLVNVWNPVPDDYTTELTEIDGFKVSVECYDALVELIAACEAAGNPCKFTSIYRSYDRQVELFEKKVNKLMGQGYSRAAAEKETGLSIAVPGTSEHQLGLAVDLKNGNGTYKWLAENSWKYGFILRYPTGKTAVTGIYYEPWHFRYVGTELAKELYDLGLCVEEYMDMLTEQANS